MFQAFFSVKEPTLWKLHLCVKVKIICASKLYNKIWKKKPTSDNFLMQSLKKKSKGTNRPIFSLYLILLLYCTIVPSSFSGSTSNLLLFYSSVYSVLLPLKKSWSGFSNNLFLSLLPLAPFTLRSQIRNYNVI